MSTQRAIFTVTADTNGMGSADVTMKLPTELTRHAYLSDVAIDVRSAVSKAPMVTISSLDDVSSVTLDSTGTADPTGTDYALGEQLFTVDLSDSGATPIYPSRTDVYDFAPRRPSQVSPGGAVTTSGDAEARAIIRTKKVRCEVDKVSSGDVVIVSVYYETAGDYRF